MGRLNKRKAQLTNLRNAKRQQLLAQQSLNIYDNDDFHAVHWEGFSDDKESDIEFSDNDNNFLDEADTTVDKIIENIQLNWKSEADNNKFNYQHGIQLSQQ